jgi:hypothetical protein
MATGYSPTSGMKAAARKAIKFKEDGKAKGAGTAVGWTRAHQIVSGESLSLDTVKRMYSFFSRHEVDKKGKDWGNQSNPSNGYIMWLAWGGDAGFSWSRKIVNQEKNMKKYDDSEELSEEIKSMLNEVIDPITETVIFEEEDELVKMDGQAKLETEKAACDCATCKEQGISCDQCEQCMSKSYVSDNEEMDKWDNMEKACWTGYTQRGMKEKDGRMVPNCVPVEKVEKMDNNETLWKGKLDPFDLIKRDFSSKQRKQMAESGAAMPDGSYPIANKNDLMNAIRSWGRGGADPKVKEHIKRRAKALGATDMLPDNWK